MNEGQEVGNQDLEADFQTWDEGRGRVGGTQEKNFERDENKVVVAFETTDDAEKNAEKVWKTMDWERSCHDGASIDTEMADDDWVVWTIRNGSTSGVSMTEAWSGIRRWQNGPGRERTGYGK